MAWTQVAVVDKASDLAIVDPVMGTVPRGTLGVVTVEGLPPGMAHVLFDIWNAEILIAPLLTPKGVRVIDCREENDIGYIYFEVTGTPLIVILVALSLALAVLGVTAAMIIVALDLPEIIGVMGASLWPIALAFVAGVTGLLLLSKSKKGVQDGKS